MKRLKSNKHLLHALKVAKPKLRNAIIKAADDDFIKALCECCMNVLNGNHKVTPALRKKLSKHRVALRVLSNRKNALRKKRKLLLQKGGFLPMLLGSILSGVLGSLIK